MRPSQAAARARSADRVGGGVGGSGQQLMDATSRAELAQVEVAVAQLQEIIGGVCGKLGHV